MTEVGRFFDSVSYTEADQADTQNRLRREGVLGEVAGLLSVGAPGGMFVSVAAGEAMVQGFHYKNTASLNLAIANNTSGSTRIDRVVLRLLRAANTINVVVVQGTPGSGLPAITQVAGGDWDYPLATVTVPTGTTAAITAAMLADFRTYSYQLTSADTINGEMVADTAKGSYKSLVVDPTTKIIQWAEYAQSGENFIDNPTMRFNQRGTIVTNGPGNGLIADRWRLNTNVAPYSLYGNVSSVPTDQGGGQIANELTILCMSNTAIATGTYVGISQYMEGYTWSRLFNQPLVLSWWDWSGVAATYAIGITSSGADRTFIHPYSVPATTWTWNWVSIPPISAGTWGFTNALGAYINFLTACGATNQTATADAWVAGNFLGHTSMTNNLITNGQGHYLAAPKLEIGHIPSRFVIPDFIQDQAKCFRQLWRMTLSGGNGRFTPRSGVAISTTDVQFNIPTPVPMRTDTPVLSINDITHMRVNAITPSTPTSISLSGLNGLHHFLVTASGNSPALTAGAALELYGTTTGDWIQFSGEL